MKISLLKYFLNTLYERVFKIGVKIVKFTSNDKAKYLHLEDELK